MLGADLAATGGTGTNELFNAGEALVKGIEFSTSINTINLSSKFKLPIYFNYTFTDAKFSDDFESAFDPWGGDIRTGYYLPYISKHLIGIGAEFKSNSFMVNLDYSYKSNFRTSPGLEMKNSNDIIESFGVLNTALNYNFNENVIGITGKIMDIKKLADNWGVFFERISSSKDDYTFNHTATVFMLDKKGDYKGTISWGESESSIIQKIVNPVSYTHLTLPTILLV